MRKYLALGAIVIIGILGFRGINHDKTERAFTEYKVLKNNSTDFLELDVRREISNGWSLVGGVSVTIDKDDDREYIQAVAK